MKGFISRIWSDWVGEADPWWIAILCGSLLLCVAVLLLARTRWIQSRRYSTCVILSVFAHGLLISAACLLKMFDQPGSVFGRDEIRVSISAIPDFDVGDEQLLVPADLPQADQTVTSPQDSLAEPEVDLDDSPTTSVAEDTLVDQLAPAPSPAPPPSMPVEDGADGVDGEPLDPPAEPEEPVPSEPLVAPDTEMVEKEPVDTAADSGEEELATAPEPAVSETPEALPANVDQSADIVPDDPVPELPSEPVTEPEAPLETVEEDAESTPTSDLPDPAPEFEPHRDLDSVADGSSPADDGWVASGIPTTDSAADDRYLMRVAPNRLQLAQRRGANERTETAVQVALKWLAENQRPDGRWDASAHGAGLGGSVDGHFRGGAGIQADTAITGLALLTFLGAGQTHLVGEHRQSVQTGLEFLLRSQTADGNLAGGARTYARMYCHGMATFALSEAYGMTRDVRLKPFLQRAVNYTLRTQDTTFGGWRYHPGQSGDTSQFGWQLMALVSSERAGLPIPKRHRDLMSRFLASVSSGRHGGTASYLPGQAPTYSMTAEALVCRLFLDRQRDSAALQEASRHLANRLPNHEQMDLYYWYYGSLGLCQLGNAQWDAWNRALQDRLLPRQRTDGRYAGSWDPNCKWGGHGGRVYSTALATLCFEVYYRYAPASQETASR